ncbi:hypothetical protein L210DRAFT_3657597 [Boletus edulis BED1]|uniref:Uncharacterized protein n=1 Tax=Boletus edulis BED1 TaxID=1328754 RepID=A0AAD4BB72_BOLED|nr:hypothetical protein L210DRAFT_3657597 [Boletus edulis BED1]
MRDDDIVLPEDSAKDAELFDELSDLFNLYINDPGDSDMVDTEEDADRLQDVADFLYDVTD